MGESAVGVTASAIPTCLKHELPLLLFSPSHPLTGTTGSLASLSLGHGTTTCSAGAKGADASISTLFPLAR